MNIPHITTCDFECDEVKGLIKKSESSHENSDYYYLNLYKKNMFSIHFTFLKLVNKRAPLIANDTNAPNLRNL